jgi:hypothetical protein
MIFYHHTLIYHLLEVKDRLVSTFTLHEMSDENLIKEIMKFSTHERIYLLMVYLEKKDMNFYIKKF